MLLKLASLSPIRHPRKAPHRHSPAPLVDAPTQTSVVVASDVQCSFNTQNPATGDCLVAYSNYILGSAIDNTLFDAGYFPGLRYHYTTFQGVQTIVTKSRRTGLGQYCLDFCAR